MNVLVVEPDAGTRKMLRRFLEARGHAVAVARDGVEALHALQGRVPDAMVAGVAMPALTGPELARAVRRVEPHHLPVMLLGTPAPGAQSIAARAADDILERPVDLDLLELRLLALVRRLHDGGYESEAGLGELIAVTSAKGGAGVSTIVANLGVTLASTRTEQGVLAIDLDLGYGDLPMLLDVLARDTVDRAIEEWNDQIVGRPLLAIHPSGLRLLAAPERVIDATRVDERGMRLLLRGLRAGNDVVIADVPAGFRDASVAALASATCVVVVVTPEMTCISRTRKLLQVLAQVGIASTRTILVLNQVTDQVSHRRIEAFVGRRIPVVVPHDPEVVQRSAVRGRPVVAADPNHPLSVAVARLARVVAPT